MRDGEQGFVIEPGSAEAVAEKLEWALANRTQLPEMGYAARKQAERCNWARFRAELAQTVGRIVEDKSKQVAAHAA